MLALRYPAFESLELCQVECVTLKPNEVRIRVAACGICGSELESYKNKSPRRAPPLVMGHEFCGYVDELGRDVKNTTLGAAVVCNAVAPCETCKSCKRGDTHLCETRQVFGMHRPGAFAEYVNVPASCLIDWPIELSAVQACLAEPLGNGVHVVNITKHLPAENVLVIGAGPIGLFCQQAFQVIRNSKVYVCDFNQTRCDVAKSLGACEVFDPRVYDIPALIKSRTNDEGVDLVIDAVGSATTKQWSIDALRPGGATVWIGLHQDSVLFDTYAITLKEKQILGTYSAKLDELATALNLLKTGKINAHTWVQHFPLSDGINAFNAMLEAKGNNIKGVLCPH